MSMRAAMTPAEAAVASSPDPSAADVEAAEPPIEEAPETAPESSSEPSPERAPALAPAEPGSVAGGRSMKGRLLGRFADYARRYLTASVEHRLTHIQEGLGDVAGRVTHVGYAVSEGRDELAGLREAVQDQIRDELQAVRGELQAVRDEISELRRELRGAATEVHELTRLPAMFGPRFDELDIKVRPMIAFDEESYAVRLRDGYVMTPRADPLFSLMVANASSRGLEPGVSEVLRALTRPGMRAADVGANVGLLSLVMGAAVGPEGRLHAFEPEPGLRRQLEKMLRVNGIGWATVHPVAVGRENAQATFHVSPVLGHSSLYGLPEADGVATPLEIEVRRLDDLIPPGEPLDVVKIDVEGAELDVLAGMPRLLSANVDIAIIAEFGPAHLARVGTTGETWFGAFARHGFEAFVIHDFTGACSPAHLPALANVESANIVFARTPAVKARLPRIR